MPRTKAGKQHLQADQSVVPVWNTVLKRIPGSMEAADPKCCLPWDSSSICHPWSHFNPFHEGKGKVLLRGSDQETRSSPGYSGSIWGSLGELSRMMLIRQRESC